jgi:threonine/homoserine/homoserine lactone efflux protein
MELNIADAIIKGVLVGLFMAISVGPTLFAVIKYSLNYSYRAGLAFVLGVSVSDFLFVTLANIAATWLVYLRPYEKYIAYGGSALLMAMGLTSFLKKQIPKRPSAAPILVSGSQYARIWLSGFLVNSLNPGAVITWLGAATLVASRGVPYRIILFVTCLIIILSVDFSKVFLAEKIKRFLTLRRIMYVQKFSGICLFLIGLMICITTFINSGHSQNGEKSSIDKILSK